MTALSAFFRIPYSVSCLPSSVAGAVGDDGVVGVLSRRSYIPLAFRKNCRILRGNVRGPRRAFPLTYERKVRRKYQPFPRQP